MTKQFFGYELPYSFVLHSEVMAPKHH